MTPFPNKEDSTFSIGLHRSPPWSCLRETAKTCMVVISLSFFCKEAWHENAVGMPPFVHLFLFLL